MAGLGRDPDLVARAVGDAGPNVLFATGIYTFTDLPIALGFRRPGGPIDDPSDAQLQSLFERDVTIGIGNTGIRAAVLKLVTDAQGVTRSIERLATVIARVHEKTGTVTCTHTHAQTQRGLDQQRLFADRGVDLGRVMIGHSTETTDLGYLETLIDNGSYLGWDRCGLGTVVSLEDQLDCLAKLRARGYAERLMLSHDHMSFIDWSSREERSQRNPEPSYTYVHDQLLPALRGRVVRERDIEQMLVRNPCAFFGQSG